jgi:FAD:protein FMN transferase
MPNISRKFNLCGGEIEIALYDVDESLANHVLEKVYDEGLRLQKIFNFFDSKSELSMLNRKRKMNVSKEMLEVLKMCLPYCEITSGKYDIAKGKQIKERKSGKEITNLKCSYKDILIEKNTITLNNDNLLIDLGSVAKGYIGDALANFLKEEGIESAYIDLRGDLIIFGKTKEKIAIQHPRQKNKTLFSFETANAAIATSGDYSQYYGDYEKSHIVGKKDIISATVIAETLAEADILATCIMVCGTESLNEFREKKFFAIDKYLNQLISEGFKNETS